MAGLPLYLLGLLELLVSSSCALDPAFPPTHHAPDLEPGVGGLDSGSDEGESGRLLNCLEV